MQVKGLQNTCDSRKVQIEDGQNMMNIHSEAKADKIQHPNKADSILDPLEDLADTFHNRDLSVVEIKMENPVKIETEDQNIQLELMMEKNEGVWKCKVCGKTSVNKTHIALHAETHIRGSGAHMSHLQQNISNKNGLAVSYFQFAFRIITYL